MVMKKAMVLGGLMVAVMLAGCSERARAQAVETGSAVSGGEAPQVKDDLFEGTEKFKAGATNVTEVNMDKNMLVMLGKSKDSAGKMDFLVVRSYEYDKPGMYKMEDLDVYRKKLTDGSWSCFVHVVEKDETTDICQRTMPDGETHEMVIMTAEPKELTFVHLRGKLSLNDLGKVTGSMGIGSSMGTGKSKDKDKDN